MIHSLRVFNIPNLGWRLDAKYDANADIKDGDKIVFRFFSKKNEKESASIIGVCQDGDIQTPEGYLVGLSRNAYYVKYDIYRGENIALSQVDYPEQVMVGSPFQLEFKKQETTIEGIEGVLLSLRMLENGKRLKEFGDSCFGYRIVSLDDALESFIYWLTPPDEEDAYFFIQEVKESQVSLLVEPECKFLIRGR